MSQSAPHHTVAARLEAKRDLLKECARQYAFGVATEHDLYEAAVDFNEALGDQAMINIKERSKP